MMVLIGFVVFACSGESVSGLMFLLPTTVSVLCCACVCLVVCPSFPRYSTRGRAGPAASCSLCSLCDSYSRFCRYLKEILIDTLLVVRRIQPMTPRSEPMPLACQIVPCLGLHRIAVVPRCHTTYLRILITQ